jgi:crotonobetainyl-CoA:carnitine CoA-transferase CaiB-like acyl-CoA transferase
MAADSEIQEQGAGRFPLAGTRVLDFTQALAGPYCTLVLADLGADVIKVEPPGRGDDSRHWGPPFVDDVAAYYYGINRNKRSIAIDLKSDAGKAVCLDILETCDAVVENWRPGVAARLGVDYQAARARRADVVYTSLSGFGAGGSARAGYDQVIQGMSGLMSVTGSPDGPPTKMGVGITDITSGMFSAIATLGALVERERTGRGAFVDVAMQDSAIALLAYQATRYFASGVPPVREGNVHNSIAPYAAFETADGYVNICVANDLQWERFCQAVDQKELLADPRFVTNRSRTEHKQALYDLLRPVLRRCPTDDLLQELEAFGVPAGPVRSLDEVFSDETVLSRGMRMTFPAGDTTMSAPGVPWKYDGADVPLRLPPPRLGQESRAVLAELGYTDGQVEALARAGAVGLA